MYGEFLSPQVSDVKIYLLKYEALAREFLIMDIIGYNFFPDQKKVSTFLESIPLLIIIFYKMTKN